MNADPMLLAELEVWHSRPSAPTRRVALGNLVLPVDPAPGFGGLLLGAVASAAVRDVDPDVVPDIHRLVDEIERGRRVVQPRLRHRFQVDRHGLARSTHRLMGVGDEMQLEVDGNGTPLSRLLGAIYAVERLEGSRRHVVGPVIHLGMRWRGPIGPALMSHLAGTSNVTLSALADPRAWALDLLGFPPGTARPSKREVTSQFRLRMRDIHPDHGGDTAEASTLMVELAEARRILTVDAAARAAR